MTPDLLVAHFARIAEAPEAIPHLRQFILDLAIRGKLVEQSPSDEPAIELLQRIQKERDQLVKDGKISRTKPPIPARADDLAFNLMPGWEAAKVSQILLELQTGPFGSTLHQSDYQKGGIPVINPASIKNERLVPIDSMAVGKETLDRLAAFKLRSGDIVMGRRGEMGRCAVVTDYEDGWLCGTGSLILRLPECVYPRFFVTLVGSPFVRAYLGRSAVGSTMQNLNQSILLSLVIGLPPLAEQHRIVAKVDELMALCDRLEAAQAERESRRDRLAAASLQRLNQPADAPAFREHARFHLSHLQRFTTRPEQIKLLRQTILHFAVMGQLVPQDSNDEPASQLIRQIESQKGLLVSNREPIAPEQLNSSSKSVPFPIPAQWEWIHFGGLITSADSGWSPQCEGFPKSGDEWGVIKVSAVSWDKFLPKENKQLLLGVAPRIEAKIRKDDFLISRANTAELVAKCVIVDEEPHNLMLSDKIVRLHLTEFCNKQFLRIVNNHAQYARAHYASEASGTSLSMKNVSRSVIYSLPVPLPPLAEQHRIVAKVDELMAICDRLEAQLTTTQTQSRRLLDAVLHEALADA